MTSSSRAGRFWTRSQNLRARLDIGIKNEVIAGLAPDILPGRGARVIDASGNLVTPGLVDLHAHVYPQGSAIGLSADEIAPVIASNPKSAIPTLDQSPDFLNPCSSRIKDWDGILLPLLRRYRR